MLQQLGQPLSVGLALIVLGTVLFWCRWRGTATTFIAIGVAGLYLLATPAVSGWLIASLEHGHEPVPIEQYPAAGAIIVLGGGIMPAAPPQRSPDLKDAADRVHTGARLYRADKAPLIIATGARPYRDIGPSAGEAAAELLQAFGVPAEAIAAPGNSTSTREDALTVLALIQSRDLDSVLLVTSAFHMQRARAAFEKVGIEAVPVPAEYSSAETVDKELWRWLPDAYAFDRANKAWREYAALLVYRLKGWI